MRRRTASRAFPAALFAVAALALGPARADLAPVYTAPGSDLAVSGHDPVAYFREGRPVEGRADLEYVWQGAVWRFSDEDSLAAFRDGPETYAPRYGGYCAWAVAEGYTASADPEAWRIVDGRLYLNYSRSVQARWERDVPGNIERGDANWPGVLRR